MKEFDYRYMVFNTRKKEYQFIRICETTLEGAKKCLFNLIGRDSKKWRFVINKVTKEESEKIKNELKVNRNIRELKKILKSFTDVEIKQILQENNRRIKENEK